MDITLMVLAAIGGYVASIFTWPTLKLWINGAQNEAAKLRAKAAAIEAAVKAKV